MSFGMERLSGARGTKYIGDALNHAGIVAEIVQITAPTVIDVLSGTDNKGNPIDFKAFMGIGANPSLGLGVVLTVPIDWRITQIQLASGSVVYS